MNRRESELLHVLIVDDSAVVRESVSAVLSKEPGVTVMTAADPLIAMVKMQRQRPDVILLDLEMPRMGGITFLKTIMNENPIPVVVCSAYVGAGAGAALAIEALEAGAVDVLSKPQIGVREFLHESAVTLIDTVRAAARANVDIRHPRLTSASPQALKAGSTLSRRAEPSRAAGSEKIIAIGASTGGTEALRIVLEAMPVDSPGMVIVQHMPEGFTAAFAARLNATCKISVKEASQGDLVVQGGALIAPGNRHLLVRRGTRYYTEVIDGPLVSRHKPSVDVLFQSIAQVAGANAVGVILTGMGDDGAQGLLEMKNAGALTIAQDKQSCVVFGMSKEAIARGAVCRTVDLHQIAPTVLDQLRGGRSAATRA